MNEQTCREQPTKDISSIIAEWGSLVASEFQYTSLSKEEYKSNYHDFFSTNERSLKNLIIFHKKYGFDCRAFTDTLVKILSTLGIEAKRVTLFNLSSNSDSHATVQIKPFGYIEPQTGIIFATFDDLKAFYAKALEIPQDQITIYSPRH